MTANIAAMTKIRVASPTTKALIKKMTPATTRQILGISGLMQKSMPNITNKRKPSTLYQELPLTLPLFGFCGIDKASWLDILQPILGNMACQGVKTRSKPMELSSR